MFSTASTLSVFEKYFLRIFQCHSYVLYFSLCSEKYLDFLQCLVFMLLFVRNISMSCIYACPLASSKFNLRKCGLSRGEQPYNFSKKPFNLVSTFNLNFNQNTNINNPNIGKVDTLAGGSILGVLDYSKSLQLTLRDANICWVHGCFCSNFAQLLLLCML